MPIIKLGAIDSTNSYLRQLYDKKELEDFTVAVAEDQFKGRGQRGTVWHSEAGKNLTCTVFKRLDHVSLEDGFYISMLTSLAIVRALKVLGAPKIQVKWPNDILSEDKKICGILIENIIRQNSLEASLIGIGLNINQNRFRNLPQASSLKLITGRFIPIDEVLNEILKQLQHQFQEYNKGDRYSILKTYESLLYRKDKPSSFKTPDGEVFPGYIKGIDQNGAIKIELEDQIIRTFEMKEIQLMF